jgi:GTPase SAR1 family protein
MKASHAGHTKVVELLLKHGANINLQDNNGYHSLMAASQSNNSDVVKVLLNHGADVNLKDNNGQTAAKMTNNDDILIALFVDDKVDALHEEVQLTPEEEAHLTAIENAIRETGTLDHTLLHGVFVGPPRSGKDSLMKRLLGEVAPNTSPSTGAVETAIHVKVEESCTYAATIGLSNWTRLEYDEEALHLMKTASDSNSSSTSYQNDGEESNNTQIADPPSAVKESTSDAFDNPQKKTMHVQTDSTSEIQPEIDPQPVAFLDETSFQMNKFEQTHQKSKHKTPIEIFKEAIKKKGLEGLRKHLTNSWSLYLTNTGGQMEFQELLPLLVSGPSMFFITFQLHKDLSECFQVEYELPSGESSKCYQSSLSILDSILQTLSTIAAMGTFVYKGLQKKCVPLKPKVFLIGTHKDLLDKKSAATIIDRIDAKLQTVIKSTSHYREGMIQFASKSRMIFTVNNHDPSDSDFQTIRSAVKRTIERGDYKMESPAHWMIYSLVVRQLKNRVESYDECFAIAKECGIKDENEFNEALHFIHTKMGLVRYFPHEELKGIVIVDPQILFEKVTELIVKTFTFENLDHCKLEAFEHMGIFSLSDLTKIRSRTGQLLTPTLLAKLLEYLRIAARFQQGGETKYFLPCALTHAQVKQSVYSSTIPPLIATFQCGYCPKGLFGTLITYLINNEMQSDFEWELDTKNIYRDEVCFQVGPYDTVTIRFKPTHLQITCAESNPDLPRINCTQEDVCQEVRESVEKGIMTVTSAINYINAQHSFTFYCTSDVCSEDPHPSQLKKLKDKLCTLKCEKLKKCFPLPSGYQKWRLCSTEVCHSLKERLNQRHFSLLMEQLSNYATKWREIGTYLKFKQEELDIIQDKPYLQSSAPTSWLSALITNWMQWAPGDSRGSTNYANLGDLKSAVSKAGLGVVADELSLQQEVAAGESGQSTDTGRKRNSPLAAEGSSKRPRLS